MNETIISLLKDNKIKCPIWLGQTISYIPYSIRPIVGKQYRNSRREIIWYNNNANQEERELYIFNRIYNIVEYAINNIQMYKEYYTENGFSLKQLKTFDDIEKIPIINKDICLKYELIQRSNDSLSRILVNTGGSSGKTLSLYIEPKSIAIENAHGTYMWGLLGYRHSDLRLTISGRMIFDKGVDYNWGRHALSLDMYKPFSETAVELKKVLKHNSCQYLHGYPSVISELAEYCKLDDELLYLLRRNLRGVFLNSEYPYPIYRNVIKEVFQVPTQSFYGHTERCIMAYEKKEDFTYYPFQTYGYTEALPNNEGCYDLIGTCYYNHATPLIRYNTQDTVENPEIRDGILRSFQIKEGRAGQFILDSMGKKISLTGLIMGRHHSLFDLSSHIQVKQSERGTATVFYVPKNGASILNASELFDSDGVSIDFSFESIEQPFRTKSGKVNLLVK